MFQTQMICLGGLAGPWGRLGQGDPFRGGHWNVDNKFSIYKFYNNGGGGPNLHVLYP